MNQLGDKESQQDDKFLTENERVESRIQVHNLDYSKGENHFGVIGFIYKTLKLSTIDFGATEWIFLLGSNQVQIQKSPR